MLWVGRACHYKGKWEGFLKGDRTVLHPVCGGGYANLHVLKFTEPYTKKKKKKKKKEYFLLCVNSNKAKQNLW